MSNQCSFFAARPSTSCISIWPENRFHTSNPTTINRNQIKIEYDESSIVTEDPLAPTNLSEISKHYGSETVLAGNQIYKINCQPQIERSETLKTADNNLIAPPLHINPHRSRYGPLTECSFSKTKFGRSALINKGFKFSRKHVSSQRAIWICSRFRSSKCNGQISEKNGMFYATVDHSEECLTRQRILVRQFQL